MPASGQQRRAVPASVVILFVSLGGALPAFSQSLGEVARQERERRKNQTPRATRVYTNDDLKKPRILDPRDSARFQAARQAPATPAALPVVAEAVEPLALPAPSSSGEPVAQTADVPQALSALPLGDVARYYQKEKQLRVEATSGVSHRPRVAPERVKLPPSLAPARVAHFSRPRVSRHAGEVARFLSALRPASEPPGVQVRSGDTLWKLAAAYLGSGMRWTELAAANPELVDPDRLEVGQWLRLPHSASAPGRRIVVREGNTMWSVARAEFGRGEAWVCIAQANAHIRNPHLIRVAQELTIPASCAARP